MAAIKHERSPDPFDDPRINPARIKRDHDRSDNSRYSNVSESVRERDQNARLERLERGPRRKQYRWGVSASENMIAKITGLPTEVEITLAPEQLEAYALNFRIEEITQKMRLNDVVPAEAERSPSPTPQYDNMGKRINTRDVRYRKTLESERHKLVQKALKLIPNYKPPADYRPPQKIQEKIYIPINDYPEINFIGLIIGPRGNTLKSMETKSGAKIAIRGKGSVKEGKGRSDVPHQGSMDDDLHCLVIADDESKIQKAIDLINNIIETAASTPEEKNELKRGQLRELAALNGTLRDDESYLCQNCGEPGHKKYDCPQRKNYIASLVCHVCGGLGHFARDCKERPSAGYGNSYRSNRQIQQPMAPSAADREYEKLMLELGTGAAPSNQPQMRLTDGGDGSRDRRDGPPPWLRNNNNNNNNNFNNQNNGGPPPWQKRNGGGNYDNNNQGRDYRDRDNRDNRDSRDGGRYNDNYNNRNNHYDRDRRGNDRDRYGNHDSRDHRDRGKFGHRQNGHDSMDRPRSQHQHSSNQSSQQQYPPQGLPQGPQGFQNYPQPPNQISNSSGNLPIMPLPPGIPGFSNMPSAPKPNAPGIPPPPPGMAASRSGAPPPPPGMRTRPPPPSGPPGTSRGPPPGV